MSGLKLSTNASVVIVVAIGAICAAYVAITESPLASTVIPVIATLVGGAVVQLLKQQSTDAKVDAGAKVSVENNRQLAVIMPQVEQIAPLADAVADNTATTESTHKLVNGQSHAAAAAAEENALLRIERAEHKAEMAALAELTRTALAELAARSAGIAEGRAQMAAEVPQET